MKGRRKPPSPNVNNHHPHNNHHPYSDDGACNNKGNSRRRSSCNHCRNSHRRKNDGNDGKLDTGGANIYGDGTSHIFSGSANRVPSEPNRQSILVGLEFHLLVR